MFIKRGFERVVSVVTKHKGLFIVLLLLQIAFLISLSFTSLHYQQKIFVNIQNIVEPLHEGNFDPNKVEAGQPLLNEIAPIIKNYQLLKENVKIMFIWFSVLFLVLNGGTWVLIHQMFRRNTAQIGQQWLKFIAISIVLAGPFLLIGYSLLRSQITTGMDPAMVADSARNILYAGVAVYYLMLVSYSFIHVRQWKSFVTAAFKAGITKIHWTVLVLLINCAVLALGAWIVYLTVLVEKLFLISLLGALFFIVLVVLTKLFWVASLQEE